jgi:hypothetical protein
MKKNTLGRKSLELKDVPVVCIENSSSGDRGHHKDDDARASPVGQDLTQGRRPNLVLPKAILRLS